MIYTDQALEQIRKSVESMGLEYEVHEMNDQMLEIDVTNNSITIPVWFDVSKQLFGFNMLAGGCKSYSDIKEFTSYFSIYMDIYTKFIPTSKMIANIFEAVIDQTTVYESFNGNKKAGYTAVFRCLGATNMGVTVCKNEFYIARLVEYNDSHSRSRVRKEYHYDLDEQGNIILLPNSDSYIDRLYSAYENSDKVLIRGTDDDDVYEVEIENLVFKFEVYFVYTSIRYNVLKIMDLEPDNFGVDDLPNPYSLEDLYMRCLSWYSEHKDNHGVVEIPELNLEEPTQEPEQEPVQEPEQEPIHEEPEVKKMESVKSSVSVVKVVKESGEVVSLQFTMDGKVYDMSLETATFYGLPADRVCEETTLVVRNGVMITQNEIEQRRFSKDVSDNNRMCSALIDGLFN